jgi:hypothetical protein
MELIERIEEQMAATQLPLFAITLAAVPCPDTPVILTLHWHGFIKEKLAEIEEADVVSYTPIPSSALQLNIASHQHYVRQVFDLSPQDAQTEWLPSDYVNHIVTPFDYAPPDRARAVPSKLEEDKVIGMSWAVLDYDDENAERYSAFWNLSHKTTMYGNASDLCAFRLMRSNSSFVRLPALSCCFESRLALIAWPLSGIG